MERTMSKIFIIRNSVRTRQYSSLCYALCARFYFNLWTLHKYHARKIYKFDLVMTKNKNAFYEVPKNTTTIAVAAAAAAIKNHQELRINPFFLPLNSPLVKTEIKKCRNKIRFDGF